MAVRAQERDLARAGNGGRCHEGRQSCAGGFRGQAALGQVKAFARACGNPSRRSLSRHGPPRFAVQPAQAAGARTPDQWVRKAERTQGLLSEVAGSAGAGRRLGGGDSRHDEDARI
jgi:hypothetical protein